MIKAMNSIIPLITPLIGLATAAIPLVLAILALRSNRTRKTTGSLETQSLKVLNIIRLPVEDQIWKKIKRKNYKKLILIIIILIGVVPIIESSIIDNLTIGSNDNILGLIFFLIFIADILLTYIYIVSFKNSYMSRCHSAYQGRYSIFKSAQILIESDYLYLFNKCHEALKIMGTQVIEVNIYADILEAFTPGTIFSRPRSIVVRIQAIEGKDGLYSVLVHENKVQVLVSSVESSKVINRFINHLISTTENTDKKTQKKIEPA